MSSVRKKAEILKIKDKEFLPLLYSLLDKGKKVKVTGLGIFDIGSIKPRTVKHVLTGEEIKTKKTNRVLFRATKVLKDMIN